MTRTLSRGLFCLTLLMTCGPGVAAQATSETRKEFWPEVDVFVELNPKVRLFFLGTITRSRETRANIEGQVGAHVDYFFHPRFFVRGGYRRVTSLGDEEDPYDEHRLILEQTFRLPVPAGLLLSDRNRGDLRWVNGEFSARYRNRLTLEREFKVWERALTPYASGELYYDSRFDTWNRNRYAFGLQIAVTRGAPVAKFISPKKSMVLDLYFMRQNDSRSQPTHVNALGLTVNLYY